MAEENIFFPYAGMMRRRGSALIIMLAFLVLLTILVVGMMVTVRLERTSANSHFEGKRAEALAELGVANAIALIREASEGGSQSGKFWSSQPGKITVFNADGTLDSDASRFLFSRNPTGGQVNLNQVGFGGVPPIASADSVTATSVPEMNVDWIPVLSDPDTPASETNRIIGRFAFWVDDETTRLNVNTADGTGKGTNQSFGPGVPTEASLTALKSNGLAISDEMAGLIAGRSGAQYSSSLSAKPFNDASEILQVAGVSRDLVAQNDFNLTAYNRAPELNLFGEPKIYLVTATTDSTPRNSMTGPYAWSGSGARPSTILSGDLQGIYPISSGISGANQLPNFTYRPPGASSDVTVRLPQFFQDRSSPASQHFVPGSPDYDMGMRIAQYLKGKNSQGQNITWPQFPGSDATGFAGKYTDRQIDSIALQVLTLMKGIYVDHYRAFSIPSVMSKGFLSGKMVRGLSRGPRVNEVLVEITTIAGSPSPKVAMAITVEWYMPEGFEGTVIDGSDVQNWHYGNGNYMPFLNFQDGVPVHISSSYLSGTPSPLGGFWMDNMLEFLDQNNLSAGVDLFGNDPAKADPDQTRAELYHNYPTALRTEDGRLYGSGPLSGRWAPMLSMYSPMGYFGSTSPSAVWRPGDYRASRNVHATSFYPMKQGVTALKLRGGLALGLHTASGGVNNGWNVDPIPLDSLRGPFMGESLSDPAVRTAVLEAVIPMPDVTIPIPGQVTIHFQVADPLVNSFPSDWVVTVDPPTSSITMVKPSGRDPTSYTTGRNIIAQPEEGGDPASIWWPEQNVGIPKSRRFPSTGYLQYLRTGLMPDKQYDSLPLLQQKGTPYRALNFAPSTHKSQQTDGGDSYPDWAMLDLFTTPAIFQPLGTPLPSPLQLTWGGATGGRINPNGQILPFSHASRTAPLEAAFRGVPVSTAYSVDGDSVSSAVDEKALVKAINEYLKNLDRPLMTPGEICNIPEIAAYLYRGVDEGAQSRNDLVRQIVGNMTTRSNTFSIWAIGQVVRKASGNTDYGNYQAGDSIQGEAKMKVLVERVLEDGADGVAGNSRNPGPDGVVGTPDDPLDPVYHPALTYPLPYRYRIISMQPITH